MQTLQIHPYILSAANISAIPKYALSCIWSTYLHRFAEFHLAISVFTSQPR